MSVWSRSRRRGSPARWVARIAAVLAVAGLASPVAASAHVILTPSLARAGDTTTFQLLAFGDRQESASTALSLVVPRGVVVEEADERSGWRVSSSRSSATWEGGRILPLQSEAFRVRLKLPAREGSLAFGATQRYEDGQVARFRVHVTSTHSLPDEGGRSLGRILSIAGIVVVLLAFAAVLAVRLARRRPATRG